MREDTVVVSVFFLIKHLNKVAKEFDEDEEGDNIEIFSAILLPPLNLSPLSTT